MRAAYLGYWSTGVVGGNKEDLSLLDKKKKGRVNPMFSVSSATAKIFEVPWASDSLFGFYLAESSDVVNPTVNRVVRCA